MDPKIPANLLKSSICRISPSLGRRLERSTHPAGVSLDLISAGGKLPSRPYPQIFFFPGISSFPIRNDEIEKDASLARLMENVDIILKEYLNLKKTGAPSDYQLSQKDEHSKLHQGEWSWNSYIKKGKRSVDFSISCPRTVELLESIPGLMTGTPFSFCFFSTLGPKTEIAPHYGPCNIRLRGHLPLIVPPSSSRLAEGNEGQDACGMKLAGETIHWEKGKLLLFDDCYEHSVWNRTQDLERVLLLFDIWHPELHTDEIAAIQDMFSHAEQQGWLK